jgi:antitoxin HicB
MSKNNLYRIRVYPVETDANTIEWAAEIPDLPGCIGAGDTAEEAVSMALDAKKAWIGAATEEGREIPKPKNLYQDDFSGKFTLRLPKTLHKELTIQAEEEGVSLNQYILYLISKGFNKRGFTAEYKLKKEHLVF